ncbi:dephospho-CoA kinase [Thermodesulforhabdus norvegica]|uniref:Dephospho-CoA kinase n=1 Tax=Thermodesulforhabdus norvegica TaxID=39841 RepID=A0A1I4QVA5_9BACT|nr:dephospho-CoA kinase [Thermodesulforhabdus norvegica]SFM43633.1 dephospho-CoA kinase [Thermodesulforhabdus norvegica]
MAYPRIALTGGIASGKSTVSSMLKELGCEIIDADQIAREIIQPGTNCWKRLRELLGPAAFSENGSLKRMELRMKIAKDPELRKRINAITHPYIIESMEETWRKHITSHPERIVIFDIPLLFESRRSDSFNFIIVVYVPPEVQIARLIKRDRISYDEAAKMIDMQIPINEKARRADWIIDNSGSFEQTKKQVHQLWEHLKTIWSPIKEGLS